MNPDVGTDDVDAIKTAPVSTANGHVVGLTVGDGVHDEVEHGGVDEDDVVHGEVVGLLDTQEAGTIALAILVVYHLSVYSSEANDPLGLPSYPRP